MSVLALIISCSFVVAVGFLVAFLWAVKSGQYEDKYTPSVRILLDEEEQTKHQPQSDEISTSKHLTITKS